MTISIKQILLEAVSPFKENERVHIGLNAFDTPKYGLAELGTVTKTNGHGHTFVKTDSGKEYVFSSDKRYRGSVLNGKQHHDELMKYLHVRPVAEYEDAKAKQKQKIDEMIAKQTALEKHKSEQIAQHAPIHKEILKKLKDGANDDHLKNLGEQVHEFESNGTYRGSEAESEVKDHHFPDLFHKITKNVRIVNALPETTAETGITHHGSVRYTYKHPGGGSNGHAAYEFSRYRDGHIEIQKSVHNGESGLKGHWERKVTQVIK